MNARARVIDREGVENRNGRAETQGRRLEVESRRVEVEGRRLEVEGRRVEVESRRVEVEAARWEVEVEANRWTWRAGVRAVPGSLGGQTYLALISAAVVSSSFLGLPYHPTLRHPNSKPHHNLPCPVRPAPTPQGPVGHHSSKVPQVCHSGVNVYLGNGEGTAALTSTSTRAAVLGSHLPPLPATPEL